ncbi:MAG: hypothetical protein IJV82_03985 [Oscillospiraceae bacterium]|nr:hypothetical protein [Oscillospiraceae bacterium]
MAKLEAVKTVEISCQNGAVVIRTDTGAAGAGGSLREAFEDLEETAAGTVFLETAEYLLITPECRGLLDALWAYLRPSCVVCLLEGEGDLEKVGTYLDTHQPDITLMDCRAGEEKLPLLLIQEERMRIVF